MQPLPCRFLDWDSNFFGFRIAQALANHLTEVDLPPIFDWCARNRIRCLYLLVASSDMDAVRVVATAPFRFADIRVTLETRLNGTCAPAPGVRAAREEDLRPMAAIARISHTASRFYADPGFPREKCDLLYETWIENSLSGYAQKVLVAEQDAKLAGYITCNWTGDRGQIGLLAVADWARNAGVGQSLVNAALRVFEEQGLKSVAVVTQGGNLTAQRLYQRCGFLSRSVDLWFHCWFPPHEWSLSPSPPVSRISM